MNPRFCMPALGLVLVTGCTDLTADPTTLTDADSASATSATDPGSSSEHDPSVSSTSAPSTGAGTSDASTSDATVGPTSSDGPSSDATTGAPALCGDGVVEAPELCDDGNTQDHDGCNATCDGDAGSALWFDVYPGELEKYARAVDLTRALTGHVVAVGVESSPFGEQPNAAWLREYTPDGALAWSKTIDVTPLSDNPSAIQTAPNGDLIIAGTAHDYGCSDGCFYGLLARFDPTGEPLWASVSEFDEPLYDLALDDEGGGYAVGASGGGWEPGTMLILRFTGDGQVLWRKQLKPAPGDSRGWLNAVALRDSGAPVVAGRYYASWPDPDPIGDDMYLAELTPEGEPVWARLIDGGEGGYDTAHDVALTDDGDIVVAGTIGLDVSLETFEQTDALWLGRFDASGEPLWSSTLDAVINSSGASVALHPEHIVVAGGSDPQGEPETRLSYASFGHDGALNGWTGTSEGPLNQTRAALLIDDGSPRGALYLCGSDDDAWIGRFQVDGW